MITKKQTDEKSKGRLLIVEDNPSYARLGLDYLARQRWDSTLAKDYIEAQSYLTNPDFSGIFIDCFFPEQVGSGKRELGEKVVFDMLKSTPREVKIGEFATELGKHVDLDGEINMYTDYIGRNFRNTSDISEILKALKLASETLGREKATEMARRNLKLVYGAFGEKQKNDYDLLLQKIKESESNQPLGFLIAEIANRIQIPFILGTSTNDHQDIGRPVIRYAKQKGWNIVQCSGENQGKDKEEFWQRAFSELEGKLK